MRVPVHLGQGAPVAVRPWLGRVDVHLADRLPEASLDGDGEELVAAGMAEDAVAVLPSAFGELHMIEHDEPVDAEQLREVARPGQVGRLVRHQDHGLFGFGPGAHPYVIR